MICGGRRGRVEGIRGWRKGKRDQGREQKGKGGRKGRKGESRSGRVSEGGGREM